MEAILGHPAGRGAALGRGRQGDVQARRVGGQVAQVKSMLARMRPSDDEAEYRQLFADLLALEDYRRELLAQSLKVQVD